MAEKMRDRLFPKDGPAELPLTFSLQDLGGQEPIPGQGRKAEAAAVSPRIAVRAARCLRSGFLQVGGCNWAQKIREARRKKGDRIARVARKEHRGFMPPTPDLDASDGVFRSRTANLSVRSALLRFDDPLGSPHTSRSRPELEMRSSDRKNDLMNSPG